MKESLPSVTMAVMGYNQEKSIGYAIDSALAQDYEGPLTLVFTDDCSADDTFRIMQEKAAAYKGPHRVLLNRNEKNLKFAGNLLRALDMAPSELQGKMDGDDYTAPDRVTRLVEAWMAHPDVSYCVGECRRMVVQDFDSLPDFAAEPYEGSGEIRVLDASGLDVVTLGGVSVWRRDIMDRLHSVFESYKGIAEDDLIGIVARMYGDLLHVDRELICYVLHSGNSSWIRREYRYASLRNFLETEEQLHEMTRKRLPWDHWRLEWAHQYLAEHDDITQERRCKVNRYLQSLAEKVQRMETELEYGARSVPAKLWYWLRHPGDSPKFLLPRVLKFILGGLLWRLKGGKIVDKAG